MEGESIPKDGFGKKVLRTYIIAALLAVGANISSFVMLFLIERSEADLVFENLFDVVSAYRLERSIEEEFRFIRLYLTSYLSVTPDEVQAQRARITNATGQMRRHVADHQEEQLIEEIEQKIRAYHRDLDEAIRLSDWKRHDLGIKRFSDLIPPRLIHLEEAISRFVDHKDELLRSGVLDMERTGREMRTMLALILVFSVLITVYFGAVLTRTVSLKHRFDHVILAKDQERDSLLVREQAARREAEAANRTKDIFLATLSHELRTPLTSISAWVQMFRKKNLDAQRVQKGLEVIEQSVANQLQLINDLLDVSRIESRKLKLNPSLIDLASLLQEAIASVRSVADEKSIKIEEKNISKIEPLVGDPLRIKQVFWNLLQNAIKFSRSGGKIEAVLGTEGNFARIEIIDQGRGIPPELLTQIFDAFLQADATPTREFGGLGLGLAISKNLVEMHNGKIKAESGGPGTGATFTVWLPIWSPATSPASSTISSGADVRFLSSEVQTQANGVAEGFSEPIPGMRILFVEDDQATREVLSTALTDAGAKVYSAANAFDALKVFSETQVDVLVSDIAMPGMDGYSLLRKIRESACEKVLPAIAISAFATTDCTKAIQQGFQAYLSKPISVNELIQKIRHLTQATQRAG